MTAEQRTSSGWLDDDGREMRGKACESVGACVIPYGKFQPSDISGKKSSWLFPRDILPRDVRRLKLSVEYHARTYTFARLFSHLSTCYRKMVTTRKGPNNASGVVWAIGEFSLYFFRVFYILTNVICVCTVVICKGGWICRERAQTTSNASFGP